MKFVKRTSDPDKDNQYYLKLDKGYNKWPVSLSSSYLFLLPLDISMTAKKSLGVTLEIFTSCQECIIVPPNHRFHKR